MHVLDNVYLVRNIIQFILPPSFLLDPSECAIPRSRWVQAITQRLDLMSISKTWYLAAWDGLYVDICIQRVDQLPLLVRTVTASETIASQIRKIHHFAFVPHCYTSDARELFVKLLDACRNLYHVSFLYPYLRDYEPTPTVAWCIPPSSCRITHLHITDFAQLSPESLPTILTNLHSQLVSLTLTPLWQRPLSFPTQEALSSALSFHALTHLRWDQTYLDLIAISSHWHLPRLQHVTIHQEEPHFALFIPFFQKHGAKVTYLAFPPTRMWDAYPGRRPPHPDSENNPSILEEERGLFLAFQDGKVEPMYDYPHSDPHAGSARKDISVLLFNSSPSDPDKLFPSLLHLVLPPRAIIRRIPPPLNATIQHIDIWTDSETTRDGILHRTKLNMFRILEPTIAPNDPIPTRNCSVNMSQGIHVAQLQSARFPALRSLRTISRAFEMMPLITSDIPPVDGFPQLALDLFLRSGSDHNHDHDCGSSSDRGPPDSTPFSIVECFGLQVEHGVGRIREVDFKWSASDDESQDPTYVPPPEDDPVWDTDPSTADSDDDSEGSGDRDGDEISDGEGDSSDDDFGVRRPIAHAEMEHLPSVPF